MSNHNNNGTYISTRIVCPFSQEADGKHEVRLYIKQRRAHATLGRVEGSEVYDHIETQCAEVDPHAFKAFNQGCAAFLHTSLTYLNPSYKNTTLQVIDRTMRSTLNNLTAVGRSPRGNPTDLELLRHKASGKIIDRKLMLLQVVSGMIHLDQATLDVFLFEGKLWIGANTYRESKQCTSTLCREYDKGEPYEEPEKICVICNSTINIQHLYLFSHHNDLKKHKNKLDKLYKRLRFYFDRVSFGGPQAAFSAYLEQAAKETINSMTKPQFKIWCLNAYKTEFHGKPRDIKFSEITLGTNFTHFGTGVDRLYIATEDRIEKEIAAENVV